MQYIELIQAIEGGYDALQEYLNKKKPEAIARELNLPCCSETGDYALHFALRVIKQSNNKSRVLTLLIEYGADPTLCNWQGESPFCYLDMPNDEKLQNILINSSYPSSPFLNVFLPALSEQNYPMLVGYFERGQPEIPDTSLHFFLATNAPRLNILELILNKTPALNLLQALQYRNQAGESPLQAAYKRALVDPDLLIFVETIAAKILEITNAQCLQLHLLEYDLLQHSEDIFGIDTVCLALYGMGNIELAKKIAITSNAKRSLEWWEKEDISTRDNKTNISNEALSKLPATTLTLFLNIRQGNKKAYPLCYAAERDDLLAINELIAAGARLGMDGDRYEQTALSVAIQFQRWSILEAFARECPPSSWMEKSWYIQAIIDIMQDDTLSHDEKKKIIFNELGNILMYEKGFLSLLDIVEVFNKVTHQDALKIVSMVIAGECILRLEDNMQEIIADRPRKFPDSEAESRYIYREKERIQQTNFAILTNIVNRIEPTKKPAVLNAQCLKDGKTLLHWAAMNGQRCSLTALKWMLNNGADPFITTTDNKLAIECTKYVSYVFILSKAMVNATDQTVKNKVFSQVARAVGNVVELNVESNKELTNDNIQELREYLEPLLKNGADITILSRSQDLSYLYGFIGILWGFLAANSPDLQLSERLLTISISPAENSNEQSVEYLQSRLTGYYLHYFITAAYNKTLPLQDPNNTNKYWRIIELLTRGETQRILKKYLALNVRKKAYMQSLIGLALQAQQYNVVVNLIGAGLFLPAEFFHQNANGADILLKLIEIASIHQTQLILVEFMHNAKMSLSTTNQNHFTVTHLVVNVANIPAIEFLISKDVKLHQTQGNMQESPWDLANRLAQNQEPNRMRVVEIMRPAVELETKGHLGILLERFSNIFQRNNREESAVTIEENETAEHFLDNTL